MEERTLIRADIDTPLFVDDVLITGINGTASVLFSDGIETQLYPQQTWSFVYNNGITNIQNFSLPVLSGWYYMTAHDARTPSAPQMIPQAILFDSTADVESGGLSDTLPTVLTLNFDRPTEIDFQQYFPLDTLKKVEVNGLPESFWKQVTATKILFQTSQERQSMTLRITGENGVTYTYVMGLVTTPAQLAITNIDSKKILT